MKLPRDLSGRQFANELCRRWGYREVRQTGSHIIIRTETPAQQTLPIPAHKQLRVGTLKAILRLVADHKGVPPTRFFKRFYELCLFVSPSIQNGLT